MSTSTSLLLDGDHTVLSVLSAIADAAVIVCLVGEHGAVVAWDNDPAACRLERTLPGSLAPRSDAPSDGQTWGAIPTDATFVQLDYEFPDVAAQVVQPAARVTWDSDGQATLTLKRGEDTTAIQAALKKRHSLSRPHLATPLQATWNQSVYRKNLERIRAYIATGDCYQANLTMPFTATLAPGDHRDLGLFSALLQHSPAPFSGFFRTPQRPSVISHSPECFLAWRGDRLTSVPIKGTRRRIPGKEETTRANLLNATKDGAELAMIVDLVRNDLGRVALPGSVRVAHDALLIDLPYVHHRAAVVTAQARSALSCDDLIRAAFPAGSITGAPKLRTMTILRDLEHGPRGAYCGTFGWIGSDGGDLAVAIRTATITGDQLRYDTGGGIVWDSDADAEWDEVHAKAAGFQQSLGVR